MKEVPQQVSASVRKLNPHLYRSPLVVTGALAEKPVAGKRMNQDSKPLLNKLESQFLLSLHAQYPGVTVWQQALRWRLGNGIWYKPDFAAFTGWTQNPTRLTCWEVKGPHAFRGGFENLKVAASLYPEVKWVLAWKEGAAWKLQEVLP